MESEMILEDPKLRLFVTLRLLLSRFGFYLSRFRYGYGNDLVALLYRVHNVLTFQHFPENCMLAVQPVGDHMSNEKLAAVGVWPGVGHGKRSGLMLVWIALAFVFEAIARAAAAGSGGVAALNHEIRNHTVKGSPVVKFVARQEHEIVDCLGCVLREELANDFAARCVQSRGVLLLRIDAHRGSMRILFRHRFQSTVYGYRNPQDGELEVRRRRPHEWGRGTRVRHKTAPRPV